jgi:hypothetical protein
MFRGKKHIAPPATKQLNRSPSLYSVIRANNNTVPIILTHFQDIMKGLTLDERVDKLFNLLDSSGNNLISLDELTKGLRDILKISVEDISDSDIVDIFHQMLDSGETEVSRASFDEFIQGGGNRINYRGFFTDCDIDEVSKKYYTSNRLWSTDVADKWVKRTRTDADSVSGVVGKKLAPCKYHQHILRACNLQGVLALVFQMKADIAFAGSKCTIGLKVESQRRLTMAQRALLVLTKAFVSDDKKNQEILFK